MTCDHDPISNLLSITKTCQQIHAECALLVFSINKFGGHRHSDDDIYSNFLDSITDSITDKQLESITHWWHSTCCMKCVKEIDAPLERLPGLRTLTSEACDKQEDPRDIHEARLKDLVRQKAGRDITVLFDYTTRFVQNPYYQADIDAIKVRDSGNYNDDDDDIDDYYGDEDDYHNQDEVDHTGKAEDDDDPEREEDVEDEQDGASSDSEDDAILV